MIIPRHTEFKREAEEVADEISRRRHFLRVEKGEKDVLVETQITELAIVRFAESFLRKRIWTDPPPNMAPEHRLRNVHSRNKSDEALGLLAAEYRKRLKGAPSSGHEAGNATDNAHGEHLV